MRARQDIKELFGLASSSFTGFFDLRGKLTHDNLVVILRRKQTCKRVLDCQHVELKKASQGKLRD